MHFVEHVHNLSVDNQNASVHPIVRNHNFSQEESEKIVRGSPSRSSTLPETNIAMENPQF